MDKEIQASLVFWNEAYKGAEAQEIDKTQLQFPEEMKEIGEKFLSQVKTILDFGCGGGDMLMLMANDKRILKAYGIENGENIVNFTKGMIEKNGFANKVEILDGGITALEKFSDNRLDGIIVSNVLDVVTYEVCEEILISLYNALAPHGLMLIKVNPGLTKENYLKMGFDNFKDNLYSKNGIMRIRDLSTDEWKAYLDKYFIIKDFCEVQWQAKGFFDRLFLVEKK